MRVKCNYCGSMIEDTADKCPNCGATNDNLKRTANKTPKTIEELKQWYVDHNLPPEETTRFFIGKDYKFARAFGIYRDGDQVIVYKNKDDGSRAIRYSGPDEAYAVNELFLKLKSEILNQKANNQRGSHKGGGKKRAKKHSKFSDTLITLLFVAVCLVLLFACHSTWGARIYSVMASVVLGAFCFTSAGNLSEKCKKDSLLYKALSFPKREVLRFGIYLLIWLAILNIFISVFFVPKYYRYDDATYVKYKGGWYEYSDSYYDYYSVDTYSLPVELYDHPSDFEYVWGDDYDETEWSSPIAFEDSDYYDDHFSSSSDSSDSGYDWGSSDSWDSGGSDWGSDW